MTLTGMGGGLAAAAAVADGVSVTAALLAAAGLAPLVIRSEVHSARHAAATSILTRQIGALAVDDRDRDVLESATLVELRRLATAVETQAREVAEIRERLEQVGRSADYAVGWLDSFDGLPPDRDHLRGLRPVQWTPPDYPPDFSQDTTG